MGSPIALTGGAYEARSLIASAQRCVNLYPEPNPKDAPFPATLYPTPGLRLLVNSGIASPVRGLYTARNGALFTVIGQTLFKVSQTWTLQTVGTLSVGSPSSMVSMSDNGSSMLVVDGSRNVLAVDLSTLALTQLTGEQIYGADRVDFVSTFFLLNRPGTRDFYVSDSNATTFDALYIASKIGAADTLVAVVVSHRDVWLIGTATSEVWFLSGAEDFPFQAIPGAFVEHGCIAKYSVAKGDVNTFWLSGNREGDRIVLMGAGYEAKRISTFAIENAISKYSRIDDATGFCFQKEGHLFYQLSFPTAGATWRFDRSVPSQMAWHEVAWMDSEGAEHAHRASCHAFAYGVNVVGDRETGKLYALDQNVSTDDGQPIRCLRSFPHLVKGGNRLVYRNLMIEIETGNDEADETPEFMLRWSDTRGKSWGEPITGNLGRVGEYGNSVIFTRLGTGRDRVFEVSWQNRAKTALNGAFVESIIMGS